MAADFPSIAVRSYDDLVIAIRAVKDFLGLSHETLEEIAGLTRGHAAKILGPQREKKIGYQTLPLILGALGIRLRVEVDPEQKTLVAGRWTGKNREQVRVRPPCPFTAEQLALAKAIIFFEHTRKATLANLAARQARRRNGHVNRHHNGNGGYKG